MKQEILEMHKKLQAFYKKMMGSIRAYDSIKCIHEHQDTLQIVGDCYQCSWGNNVYDADCCYRIPLPINRDNPERGLWGMVDWSKLRYEQWGPDGELAIFKLPYIQYNEDMGIPIKDHPFVVAEPETALLMALLEQEGL